MLFFPFMGHTSVLGCKIPNTGYYVIFEPQLPKGWLTISRNVPWCSTVGSVSSAWTLRRKSFFLEGNSNAALIAFAGKANTAGEGRAQIPSTQWNPELQPQASVSFKETANLGQILQRNKYFLRNQLMEMEWLTRTSLEDRELKCLKQKKKKKSLNARTMQSTKKTAQTGREFSLRRMEIIIY